MKYKQARVERRLEFATTALKASTEENVILSKLERFGYDLERLKEGQQLLDYALFMQEKMSSQGKPDTPRELEERLKEAKDTFWELRTVATVALKLKHQLIVDLFIDRPIDATIAGFFRQARHFYNAAMGNQVILKELARFNISDDQVTDANIALEDTIALFKDHHDQLGDQMQAVKFGDEAMKKLDTWMEDFIKIAQVALHKDADLMKKIGFRAK